MAARVDEKPVSIETALARATERLREAGVETARLDARLLLSAAAGCSVEQIVAWPEREVPDAAAEIFASFVSRRVAREPLAQILGKREFWSLSFATTRDTLTPRPDSETVIEAVLTHRTARDGALRILDLGTGTGCLLLALLSEYRRATGLGTDLSPAALRIAATNAAALGLADRARFVATRWDDGVEDSFDVIVSNPPYIPVGALAELAPEVRVYEPRLALDGGPDGLSAYRELAPRLHRRLRIGGLGVVEVGAGQAPDVERVFHAADLGVIGRSRDLAGVERCILIQR